MRKETYKDNIAAVKVKNKKIFQKIALIEVALI